MSLCELEATGIFGWADIVMWMFCSAITGGWLGIKVGRRLEVVDPRGFR
jgi:hypothetical protein